MAGVGDADVEGEGGGDKEEEEEGLVVGDSTRRGSGSNRPDDNFSF